MYHAESRTVWERLLPSITVKINNFITVGEIKYGTAIQFATKKKKKGQAKVHSQHSLPMATYMLIHYSNAKDNSRQIYSANKSPL